MDKINNWEITRYQSCDVRLWNEKVRQSRNGTFLHLRGYMDYHADRFKDCSLIAYKNGKPMALLPANITEEGILRSHGGLTYGGWLLPSARLDGSDIMSLFEEWIKWCRTAGLSEIDYRPVPAIYHRRPAEEDLYALFRFGARQTGCGLSSTICYASPTGFDTMRRRLLRKATAEGGIIEEQTDAREFHALLSDCLAERHNTKPVHTVEELQMLRDRFPDNIRIFSLKLNNEICAGVCMYLTDTVAHAQYIATSDKGRELNQLTPLFNYLIELFSTTCRWFDFGISTEDGGHVLNSGLLRQKFSFGGTGTVYQRYSIIL